MQEEENERGPNKGSVSALKWAVFTGLMTCICTSACCSTLKMGIASFSVGTCLPNYTLVTYKRTSNLILLIIIIIMDTLMY
jgi:hypothetical protein